MSATTGRINWPGLRAYFSGLSAMHHSQVRVDKQLTFSPHQVPHEFFTMK